MESRRVSLGWSLPLALGLALIVLARAGGAPTTLAAGEARVDALGSWWFQWLVERAIFHGESLLHTDTLFFPWGKDILRDTGANILDAALIAPARLAFGAAVAWNLLYLLVLLSNGLAGGVVGRRAGGIGLVAGTALAVLHPVVLHELEMGRPTQAILAPLIGALVLGDAALTTGGTRRILGAGLLLALAGWFYWYSGIFGGLGLLILGARQWRRLGGIYVVAALATAPVVVPLLLQVQAGVTPGLLPVSRWWSTLDLGTAQGDHMHLNVLGAWGIATFVGERDQLAEGIVLGAGALLAALGAPGRWRAVSLLAVILALGPRPMGVPNPLYIGLASALPPLWRLYWPARFLTLVVVAGVVGARTRVGQIGAAVLVAEALVRGPLVLQAWSPATPAPVAGLVAEDGAVLSLPYGMDQWALVHQTAHARPLLNGMHERFHFLVPPEQEALRTTNSFVAALILLPTDARAVVTPTDADRQAFVDLGYRWVVLRRDALLQPTAPAPRTHEREVLRALVRLLGPPAQETEEVALWDLRATPPAPPSR